MSDMTFTPQKHTLSTRHRILLRQLVKNCNMATKKCYARSKQKGTCVTKNQFTLIQQACQDPDSVHDAA